MCPAVRTACRRTISVRAYTQHNSSCPRRSEKRKGVPVSGLLQTNNSSLIYTKTVYCIALTYSELFIPV